MANHTIHISPLCRYKYFVLIVYICFLLALPNSSVNAEVIDINSAWDRSLVTLEIENVKLEAQSLFDAWQKISRDYLVRSVLYVSEESIVNAPFLFESRKCSTKDIFNALTSVFNEFTWTQDEQTGVIWVYPASISFTSILSNQITIPDDQFGIPMQTGILESLDGVGRPEVRPKRWGTLFTNTFNYAVDVPKGTYTIRDLLNLCCVASPSSTFLLQAHRDFCIVTPVNLSSDEITTPPVGALQLWKVAIESPRIPQPTTDDLIEKLSDHNPRIRNTARKYLEAMIWPINTEDLVRAQMPPEKALWVCLGVTSIIVRIEEGTHTEAIKRMKKEVNENLLLKGDAGLAVLTALELCRLTKDTSALDTISKRTFGKGELSGVVSDAWRIARGSDVVWNALRAKGAPEWLGASEMGLRQIGSIPTRPERLRFSANSPK